MEQHDLFSIWVASAIVLMFAIPVEVMRDQVLPFLTLKQLVNLDSATCHKKSRIELKKRLQGYCFIGSMSTSMGINGLKWLAVREISLENIMFGENTTNELLSEYGAVFSKTRRCILGSHSHITNISHQGIVYFADNSPRLEHLNLTDCRNLTSGYSIAYLTYFCKILHSIDLSRCLWMRDCDMEILSVNCR